MERPWLIFGAIFLLILAVLITIYFFIPLFSRSGTNVPSPIPSPVIQVSTSPSPVLPSPSPPLSAPTPVVINPSPVVSSASRQLFSAAGFTLTFPENWGVITCANSFNFEFDPVNNVDQTNIPCDVATRPITVIVQDNLDGCTGSEEMILTNQVIKSSSSGQGYIENQWCVATTPALVITNRVSPTVTGIASPIDYSKEIEDMIASLQF